MGIALLLLASSLAREEIESTRGKPMHSGSGERSRRRIRALGRSTIRRIRHGPGLAILCATCRFANARMPGRDRRLFMALAVLAGVELGSGRRWWRTPLAQWLIITIVAFEYWDAPIPLTTLDRPAAYQMLAASPPGAVCEVPFGIGDGLSTGVGSQDRAALYYATVHEHPLAGGYIGRMPADAARRYEAMAIAATLLRLSDGRADAAPESGVSGSPCAYLVVNRAARSDGTFAFTVGQLRGLGVATGSPAYVLEVDPAANRVVVGAAELLRKRGLVGDADYARCVRLLRRRRRTFEIQVQDLVLHITAPDDLAEE